MKKAHYITCFDTSKDVMLLLVTNNMDDKLNVEINSTFSVRSKVEKFTKFILQSEKKNISFGKRNLAQSQS